ncbi:MAG TPA: CBS domain-containing protein [Burkholderiales bacterium]|nr:CBS domain-containing protein [Burkholderiales bacterium]
MNVERIYSRNIVRVPRSSTLRDAAILMRDYHVGALLVTEDAPNEDRVMGIVTDRDLVLQAMAEGIGPDDATIGEVMTPDLVTIEGEADLHEAMETMRENGVRRLAVTADSGALVGVVSFDDVVDALAAEVGSLAGILKSEREFESAQFGNSALRVT